LTAYDRKLRTNKKRREVSGVEDELRVSFISCVIGRASRSDRRCTQ
jgi:hypothetical protein